MADLSRLVLRVAFGVALVSLMLSIGLYIESALKLTQPAPVSKDYSVIVAYYSGRVGAMVSEQRYEGWFLPLSVGVTALFPIKNASILERMYRLLPTEGRNRLLFFVVTYAFSIAMIAEYANFLGAGWPIGFWLYTVWEPLRIQMQERFLLPWVVATTAAFAWTGSIWKTVRYSAVPLLILTGEVWTFDRTEFGSHVTGVMLSMVTNADLLAVSALSIPVSFIAPRIFRRLRT